MIFALGVLTGVVLAALAVLLYPLKPDDSTTWEDGPPRDGRRN